MRILITVFVAVFALGAFSGSEAQAKKDQATLADFQVIEPYLASSARNAAEDFVLEVSGWGQNFSLELTENEQLLENMPAPDRAALQAGGDRFLSGKLAGVPGSWVRLNRIDGQISGVFYDGSTLFLIDSPEGFEVTSGVPAPSSATILYRFNDLEFDGLIDDGGVPSGLPPQSTDEQDAFFGHLRGTAQMQGELTMPITIVADTDFKDDLGNSARSTAIGRLNFVDGIFASQLGVGLSLWHYAQLQDNGPLTSTDSNTLLTSQFRSFMSSGDGSIIPFRGLAHLFTGRNLDGNTVGIAYIGVLCSRFAGYGVNQNLSSDTTSSLVFAHELGHNYNAQHTDVGIMRASIGGAQEFSDVSIGEMSGPLANANCLVARNPLIFNDDFGQ